MSELKSSEYDIYLGIKDNDTIYLSTLIGCSVFWGLSSVLVVECFGGRAFWGLSSISGLLSILGIFDHMWAPSDDLEWLMLVDIGKCW